ncbi:MAG: c-type cytochrome [Acidobacteria bacterium]|nr:c-type cytochrome [Acidobacteriota bacterium]
MKRYLPVVILTCSLGLAADPPEQAKRGEALFALKSASGYACTTCHQLGGQGTAVGPDLKTMSRLHPRAVVMAILATRTQSVIEVSPKGGKAFPAMKAGNDEYFDLNVNPPAKRALTAAEIRATRDNGDWKHPPESRGLTKEQLADLIAYIRFASFGDTKGVDPADIPNPSH